MNKTVLSFMLICQHFQFAVRDLDFEHIVRQGKKRKKKGIFFFEEEKQGEKNNEK